MADLPVEFDQQAVLGVADISTDPAATTHCRDLSDARRQSMWPFDVAKVAQLEDGFGALVDVVEQLEQMASIADPAPLQQSASQPLGRCQTALYGDRDPVHRVTAIRRLDLSITEIQHRVVYSGPLQTPY